MGGNGTTINKSAIRVMVVEDEISQRTVIGDILLDAGYSVDLAESGERALELLEQGSYQAVVTDLKMPGVDGIQVLERAIAADENTVVVLVTAYGTVDTAVTAMKYGATDYLNKPLRKDELLIVLEKALKSSHMARENRALHAELENRYHFDKLIGASAAMTEVYRLIGKVLNNDSTVLISGESGTGKELVARAIHFSGARRKGQFVAVNCAAIPENLIESELFGHEKGAFSGASGRRIGKFESAVGGTLFLDEISTLHYDLQAKFLRALQEREIQRLGGDQTITVDVRIVTASNQDLRKLAADGRFRDDLFHRLNVVNINLPPLRRRKEDIPLLVKNFLDKYRQKYDKPGIGIAVEAVEAMADYDWPGNVRELENMVEQLVVLSDNIRIESGELPSYVFEGGAVNENSTGYSDESSGSGIPGNPAINFRLPAGGVDLATVEESLIRQALQQAGGRVVGAAKLLGVSYKTLQYRIKKFEIDTEEIKTP